MSPSRFPPDILFGPRVLTLDVESRHLAADVGGWDKFMAGAGGISALVLHDGWTNRYRCFNDTTLEKAAAFIEGPEVVLVTFNGKGFDVPLLQALLGRRLNISAHRHIDLYQLAKSAKRESDPARGGYSLDAIARRTLDCGKEESGEHAPALAEKGLWLTLFRYCKKDVDLTRRLFLFAREHGGIISHSGDLLPLALPDWLRIRATEVTQ
mgnify:CR=1 FL=1